MFSKFCAKHSFNFVQCLWNNCSFLDQMCSFKSHFNNLPLVETISIWINQFSNSNLNPPVIVTEVCQSLLYMSRMFECTFNNFIYKQFDGVAMGSILGPVLENIFIDYFVSKSIKDVEKPLNYLKYLDDIFVSYKSDYNINVLFDNISNLYSSFKFTIENEIDSSLSFLDIFL